MAKKQCRLQKTLFFLKKVTKIFVGKKKVLNLHRIREKEEEKRTDLDFEEFLD